MRRAGTQVGRGAIVVSLCLLLGACGRNTPTDLKAIRAEVGSLAAPAGWVPDGGVRYECEGINLDCGNTSSGVAFDTSTSVPDACAAVVDWVTTTPAFVAPSGLVGLTTWVRPTTANCTAEMGARGRYLLRAGGPSDVPASADLAWQVLMSSGRNGLRLTVVLGDPPKPIAELGL